MDFPLLIDAEGAALPNRHPLVTLLSQVLERAEATAPTETGARVTRVYPNELRLAAELLAQYDDRLRARWEEEHDR